MKTHTTNYQNTFIRIAKDSKASVAEAPPDKLPKSQARLAYEMLIDSPYVHTSDDVLYETTGKPKGISREEFFQKGQPCMRASMLTKRYGFGVRSDEQGRIALVPAGTEEYEASCADPGLSQIVAMQSSRG